MFGFEKHASKKPDISVDQEAEAEMLARAAAIANAATGYNPERVVLESVIGDGVGDEPVHPVQSVEDVEKARNRASNPHGFTEL